MGRGNSRYIFICRNVTFYCCYVHFRHKHYRHLRDLHWISAVTDKHHVKYPSSEFLWSVFFYHIQTEYRGLQSKFPCLFWIQENKDEIALQTQTPSTQFSVSRSLCTYIKHCHFCIWLFYMSKTIFFRILPGSPYTIYLVLFWACLLRQYLVYLYIIFPCTFFWWIKKT